MYFMGAQVKLYLCPLIQRVRDVIVFGADPDGAVLGSASASFQCIIFGTS